MPQVCFYFLLHQPYRLTNFAVTDLDNQVDYFTSGEYDQNREVFLKVTEKSYRPMLTLLLELVAHHPQFKFSFSTSGTFLEQAQAWAPDVVDILQKLSLYSEQVEILAENYYHSLAGLYSELEFAQQIKAHELLIEKLFHRRPKIFRNTEMIYNNYIAYQVARLGYQGILTEAVDRHLHGRPRTQVYRSNCTSTIPVLLKHAHLSDDIAFRFSQQSWSAWPLTSEKYLQWLANYYDDETIGLFMDFETFGEHQWASTGIFEFFYHLINDGLHQKMIRFVTPSAVLIKPERTAQKTWLKQLPVYDVDEPISWADEHRDLSAWRSNDFQIDTLQKIYALEKAVYRCHDSKLLEDWRRLQTSDHYYYMCTKYCSDGDVHAYFSAYDSPLEAYRRFCIVLADITERCRCQTT